MQLTNSSILEIALQQSAADLNCNKHDFLSTAPIIVPSVPRADARKYLELPFDCHMVSYGTNVVAAVKDPLRSIVRDYLRRFPTEHCFETPAFHILNDALQKQDLRICFMAEYFLPDLSRLNALNCAYPIRPLPPEDFPSLYTKEWSNALCEKRKELDVMALGAYDGSKLIGLAGCSADCDTMWQIGIDVLPEYRRRSVASALTSQLALAVLEAGKVPFYCAAWSNIPSVRNAIRSGFRPAWVEMTAKPSSFVARLNASDTL